MSRFQLWGTGEHGSSVEKKREKNIQVEDNDEFILGHVDLEILMG